MSVVVAVVPSYRPDHDSLMLLVESLLAQGIRVLVADDGSPSTVDATLHAASERGVTVVRHDHNAGIARSLNDGLRFAADNGAGWLLTIDQDSSVGSDYVALLSDAIVEAEAVLGPHGVGAIGAGRINDASGRISYPIRFVSGLPSTEELIQSGTAWSVAGLIAINGFDESLGIDAVDAAAGVRLRAAGRRLLVAPGLSISHHVGEGRQVSVLGRRILASGHSPERRTTIVRNRLRLAPEEFAQSPLHAFRTLRRVAVGTLLAVTVEDDRWAKAKASARGLFPKRAAEPDR